MIPHGHIIRTVPTSHGTYHASLLRRVSKAELEPVLCTLQFDKQGFETEEAAIEAVTHKFNSIPYERANNASQD